MAHIQHPLARRAFLKRAAAMAAVTGSPFAANLAMISDAVAQTVTDYKALVCVFLNGGNDHGNTIAPISGAAYNAYASARNGIAMGQSSLLPITPATTTAGAYAGPAIGLHPSLAGVRRLFNTNRCAVLANVATLVQPTSKAQYNGGQLLPLQLFSHSDQQNSWQTGFPDSASQTGWLGRVGDAMLAANGSSPVSMCMSLGGNNIIQVGTNVIQYQLTTQGSVQISGISAQNGLHGNAANAALMRQVIEQTGSNNLFENEYATIVRRSITADESVRAALATAPASTGALLANNPLAAQLNLVARMIAARSSLGHKRQIYYVTLGGFDFHSNLLTDQAGRLALVSDALEAFYNATVTLNVADKVTTFTASDFGRALLANGDGSDHGWGGHHFIVGGAVNGGKLYGRFPDYALGSNDDVGEGRLLPSTSVDEYAAVLARWFGVTDLTTVLPQLTRFGSFNMDFV